MSFNRGDRVQTFNGVPATVKKTRFKKVYNYGKKVALFCTVQFDCDRQGKTWEMPEAQLIELKKNDG